MAQKPIIELDNIRRDFVVGEEIVHALRGVSFTINDGEFVAVMGESGSGKSTLLAILSGILDPDEGKVLFNGEDLYSLSDEALSEIKKRAEDFYDDAFQNLISRIN